MSIVSIDNLTIARGGSFTLHIPSLRIKASHILCVAGPNGSGKTTLIECLAGLTRPTKGTVSLDGHAGVRDLRSLKARTGYIPDDDTWFIKELCAQEYFELLEDVYHKAGVTSDMRWRASMLAHALSFTSFKLPLSQLSHGNKRKVQIIAGLMHMPAVIIIDELRNGLDPLSIIAAEQLIRQEARRGACIIAATHDLWWAERFAHDVVLLSNGQIAVQGPKRELVKRYGSLEKLFIAEAER